MPAVPPRLSRRNYQLAKYVILVDMTWERQNIRATMARAGHYANGGNVEPWVSVVVRLGKETKQNIPNECK